MNTGNLQIRRYAALFLAGGVAAIVVGPGCSLQHTDGESDGDVGTAEEAASHVTGAPAGDPRLQPTCTKTTDNTLHNGQWPFHAPGLCPATDEFTFNQAAATCGSDVKYFSFTCTEFVDGTHSWTAYFGCCNSSTVGCSDGTREGFTNLGTYPTIASCAAGWSIPGVLDLSTTGTPACGRQSGNTSSNPSGTGCNVADACGVGWHVCNSAADVDAHLPPAATSCGPDAGTGFFTSRQSGPGFAVCGSGANDIFGCGSLGDPPDATSCGVLDKFSNNLCGALPNPPWSCGTNGEQEANAVVKSSSNAGGVLCCSN